MKTTLKDLLTTAEADQAACTYQTLKDFEKELREMFEAKNMSQDLRNASWLIKEILGEE